MRQTKKFIGLYIFLMLLVSCAQPSQPIMLSPIPVSIESSTGISEELSNEKIYWKNAFIYLDGSPVEYDPITKLRNEDTTLWNYKFSSDNHYLVYRYDIVMISEQGFPTIQERIGLLDLLTNETIVLVNGNNLLSGNTRLGGAVFNHDNTKALFSVLWADEQGTQNSDLAFVDISSREVEMLGMRPLPFFSLDLDISPDGKRVVYSDASTLQNKVCNIVNLEEKTLECLELGKGWYQSIRFTPDNNRIVFAHGKDSEINIFISDIERTEYQKLVSGLLSAKILFMGEHEFVFSGSTYDNYKCANIYVINYDGSNFRKLTYLDQQCLD